MKMYRRFFLFGSVMLTLLLSCETGERETWMPETEKAGYAYLETATSDALRNLESSRMAQQARQPREAAESLDGVMQALLKIQRYYLPLTEARQSVFEAERHYYFNHSEKSRQSLAKARLKLQKIIRDGGETLAKSLNDAIYMLDELETMETFSREDALSKFHLLYEKINLLAVKGELVLAEIRFPGGAPDASPEGN
jgi:hypothetical protein